LNLLDLLDYVEKNPKDYEKRWTLAKKLYQNKDYSLALDHLTVLVNEWEPHINVYRFLSATLYRLGKYEDAIEKLKKAIEIWGNEPGLYEQLGRIYVTIGKYDLAKQTYEKLHEICPEHKWAHVAIERLKRHIERKTVKKRPFPVILATDFDLLPESICKRCGSENPKDNDHCWKCGETLRLSTSPPNLSTTGFSQNVLINLTPEIITLFLGLVLIIFVSINIFMSLTFWLQKPTLLHTHLSFWDIYQNELLLSRIITGFSLLIISPLLINLISKIMGVKESIHPNLIILVGILIASIVFLFSWLPKFIILWGFAFIPLFAFLIILGTFGISLLKALNICLLYILSLLISTILLLTLSESYQLKRFINPISQIPSTVSFFRTQYPNSTRSLEIKSEDGSPVIRNILWNSTGSYWLDTRSKEITITLFLNDADEFVLEVNRGETKPIIYEKLRSERYKVNLPIETDTNYTIKISTSNNTPFVAIVQSLFIANLS